MEDTKENDKQIAKALRNRDHALCELVETEKTYVNGLGKLIIIYMNPLKHDNYKIISISDYHTIFPSVVSTIYNLHNQLLAELDYNYYHTTDDNNKVCRIGKVLIKYVELFKMYQIYMNGYERATKSLKLIRSKNKKFNKWLQLQSNKTCISAGDLENLLILPIQRIPRYQLLVKEIIKQTEKINKFHLNKYDNDLNDLRNIYTQINDITKLIETKMKEYDNKTKVALIEKRFHNISAGDLVSPSRYYITESNNKNNNYIKIHNCDGTTHNIILFLFNDCLIYGHYNEEAINTLSFKSKLNFDNLLIFDNLFKCIEENNYKKAFNKCLKIYSRNYSIWISFKTKKLRSKWFKLIIDSNENVNNKYINKYKNFNKLKTQKQMLPYPCFVPDDYTNYCQQCNSKFTYISNRKHHCKQCGRLLCKLCTNYRINSIFLNKNKKNKIIRCCKKCKNNNTFSNISIKNNNTIQCEKRNMRSRNINNYNIQIRSRNINRINRSHRTNSQPMIKSPALKCKTTIYNNNNNNNNKPHTLEKRISTPLLINTSSTTTYIKSPTLKPVKMISKYNLSDDSLSIDIDDDDEKSISISIDYDMPILNISDTISDNNKPKHIQQKHKRKPRRSRSYAVGLPNECNLSYVGCVITDDETDDNTFIDQLLLTSSENDQPSSGESKKETYLSLSQSIKIQKHSSFRNNYKHKHNLHKKHYKSKSLTWL